MDNIFQNFVLPHHDLRMTAKCAASLLQGHCSTGRSQAMLFFGSWDQPCPDIVDAETVAGSMPAYRPTSWMAAWLCAGRYYMPGMKELLV
jgi:hypothetical protein